MASVIKGLFIIICTSCVDLMNSQLHLSQLVSRHALLSQYLPVVVIQLLDGKCRTRWLLDFHKTGIIVLPDIVWIGFTINQWMRWVAESHATIVFSAPLRSCINSQPSDSLLQRRRQGYLVNGLLFDFKFLYVWLRWLLWLLEDDWASFGWFSCLVLWRWCLIILIWSEFRRPSRDLRVIIVWYPTVNAAKREVLMTWRGIIVIRGAALMLLESVDFEIFVLHQVVEVVRSSLAWVLLLILLLLLV